MWWEWRGGGALAGKKHLTENAARITIINMEMCTMYTARTGREAPLCEVRVSVWGGGEGTHPDEHEDEHGDKVVGSGDRVLVGQAEQVHDGGAHAEDALDFVARRLVRVDGPDLGLSGGPGGLLQVDLRRGRQSIATRHSPPSR